jgi:hypothetical protein
MDKAEKLKAFRDNFKTLSLKEKKKIFISVLEENLGNISASTKLVGIDRSTYYAWIGKDEKFKKSCEDVIEVVIDFVESSLMKNIRDGKENSIIFYLRTKGKHRGYIEQYNSVNTTVALEKNDLESKTTEELMAIINREV